MRLMQWQLAIVLSFITLTDQPSSFKYWNLEYNNLTITMSVSRIKLARAFNEQWKPSKKSHNLVLQNHFPNYVNNKHVIVMLCVSFYFHKFIMCVIVMLW